MDGGRIWEKVEREKTRICPTRNALLPGISSSPFPNLLPFSHSPLMGLLKRPGLIEEPMSGYPLPAVRQQALKRKWNTGAL